MKILERNYQNSIQSYLAHDNEDEAREGIRGNLLSRLSNLVSRDLDQEEIDRTIVPHIKIRVIRVCSKGSDEKPLYVGGLSLPNIRFTKSEEPISPEIDTTFKKAGVDLPTSDILDRKLDRMYSNNSLVRDPFGLNNISISDISNQVEVSDAEFSHYLQDSNDTEYADNFSNHFRMLRAVSLMALHKHVTENPTSPKERLLAGVDNLTRELTDAEEKENLKSYLLMYINRPDMRPMLVKEADLVIKRKTEGSRGVTIPTWVIVSVVSALLLGGLIYNQRNRIADAWRFSKEVSGQAPEKSQKLSFFKSLFSPSGRSVARDYMNNDRSWKTSTKYLSEMPVLKKESEATILRSDFNKTNLMNQFLGK